MISEEQLKAMAAAYEAFVIARDGAQSNWALTVVEAKPSAWSDREWKAYQDHVGRVTQTSWSDVAGRLAAELRALGVDIAWPAS